VVIINHVVLYSTQLLMLRRHGDSAEPSRPKGRRRFWNKTETKHWNSL